MWLVERSLNQLGDKESGNLLKMYAVLSCQGLLKPSFFAVVSLFPDKWNRYLHNELQKPATD
jgi:hypothetical protein